MVIGSYEELDPLTGILFDQDTDGYGDTSSVVPDVKPSPDGNVYVQNGDDCYDDAPSLNPADNDGDGFSVMEIVMILTIKLILPHMKYVTRFLIFALRGMVGVSRIFLMKKWTTMEMEKTIVLK